MINFKGFINKDNIDEASAIPLPPKLHRLLRLGLADKAELETYRRALRTGEDDNEIFRRMRNRIQKGDIK